MKIVASAILSSPLETFPQPKSLEQFRHFPAVRRSLRRKRPLLSRRVLRRFSHGKTHFARRMIRDKSHRINRFARSADGY
jgi:hypothetical protein